jgi:hypothetical protein
MNNVEESAGGEDIAKSARRRTVRRIERFDILVASLLLLSLIFGWAKDLAPAQRWASGDLLTASHWSHAWSGGGALR